MTRTVSSTIVRVFRATRHWDYRVLLLGALLPDIIDKPTSLLFPTVNTGRGFGHTLFFVILAVICTLLLVKNQKLNRAAPLAFGIAAHLVLDLMWRLPQTLLWPLQGWHFAGTVEYSFLGYLEFLLNLLKSNPAVIVPELLGLFIMVAFVTWVIKRQIIGNFVRYGFLYTY